MSRHFQRYPIQSELKLRFAKEHLPAINQARGFRFMAQAIMNPEEVRRFAKELKRFNEDIQTRASSLQAGFAALGSSWQDQEHEKFAEEFLTTMRVLKKFMEIADQHAPYLLRKAQRIEEYLDQQ